MIFVFSCLVSFYFHSQEPASSKLHKKSEKKSKKHHSKVKAERVFQEEAVEDSLDAPSFDEGNQNEIPDFQSFNEDEERSGVDIRAKILGVPDRRPTRVQKILGCPTEFRPDPRLPENPKNPSFPRLSESSSLIF